MQKTNSGPEAKAELEAQDALKKRAAKQAAKRELAPVVHDQVGCVVLPQGDAKISMGEHIAGLGTAHYEEGEKFSVDLPIALSLYRRGFVNFDGARDALRAALAQEAKDVVRANAEEEAFQKLAQQAGL